MYKIVKRILRRIIFSFPVQLVIVQVKKNHSQVLYWVLLYCFIAELFMARNGVPHLFFDPEYGGHVNGFSFFIVGLCFGIFTIAYNISSYLLNSHRFPFLASLSRTFFKYSLNNFIIPAVFLLIYFVKICGFQIAFESKSIFDIMLLMLSFLGGIFFILSLSFWYFNLTDKNIFHLYGIKPAEDDGDDIAPLNKLYTRKKIAEHMRKKKWIVYVEVYLASFTKIKLVRDTSHYDEEKLKNVLRKNHYNAAVFQTSVLVLFLSLGFLRDIDVFQIPAAGSIFLLFTIGIMLSGLFTFWLGSWSGTAALVLFLFINWISGFETFTQHNQVYGINYGGSPVSYNPHSVDSLRNENTVSRDKQNTIAILEKWKRKNATDTTQKPVLVMLNVSGGGLRSMVFTFNTLKNIDSVMGGKFMDHTMMIAGSSGGMIAASYYRQLFYDNLIKGKRQFPFITSASCENIGKDLLNNTMFSLTVNDLFFSWQTYNDGKYTYAKDRAYAWEQQFSKNTGHILDHRLRDYLLPEQQALIPMLILTPTIVNDGSALFISPQGVSYLIQGGHFDGVNSPLLNNGVEFTKMFAAHDAYNLQFTSALRVNATFPYVMPPASFPTYPLMECMDSGIRDNFGMNTTLKFLNTFREWIETNTSGVAIVQIRDTYKQTGYRDNTAKTILQDLFAPVRNVSNNVLTMQDYNNDTFLLYLQNSFAKKIKVVTFELPDQGLKLPISWHLTNEEKEFTKAQTVNSHNSEALRYLQKLIIRE